jgi:Med18 protein
MQEYALYGQVSGHDYPQLLQQLAGVARMQPRYVQELHLVFKANVPPGLSLIPTATSSERLANPDAQRISKMLTASLHYVQLVGTIETVQKSHSNGDVEMTNGSAHRATKRKIRWEMEFKDTPEPGKQAVSSRQVSRTPIDDGDVMGFMQAFGFGSVFISLSKKWC